MTQSSPKPVEGEVWSSDFWRNSTVKVEHVEDNKVEYFYLDEEIPTTRRMPEALFIYYFSPNK